MFVVVILLTPKTPTIAVVFDVVLVLVNNGGRSIIFQHFIVDDSDVRNVTENEIESNYGSTNHPMLLKVLPVDFSTESYVHGILLSSIRKFRQV